MQWFAAVALAGFTVLVIHFALAWYRKIPQHGRPASRASGLLLRVGITAVDNLPEAPVDARIARIISEIPQRRIRQHS